MLWRLLRLQRREVEAVSQALGRLNLGLSRVRSRARSGPSVILGIQRCEGQLPANSGHLALIFTFVPSLFK